MTENSNNRLNKRIERRDIGTLDVLNHGDGFLRARVRFARAGVFPYVVDGKTVYEAKLPEEIFSLSTIDSAKRVPVTDGHPYSLVSSSNYADHVRGTLGDSIVVAEGFLEAEETVFDSALIEKIKNGKATQVSIGFTCEPDNTAGEYNGTRYDSVQRNIKINHIAHVAQGRAGEDVRAYLDSQNGSEKIPTTNINFKFDEIKKEQEKMSEENKATGQTEDEMSEQKIFEAIKKFFEKLFLSKNEKEENPKEGEPIKGDAMIETLKENAKLKKARLDIWQDVNEKEQK